MCAMPTDLLSVPQAAALVGLHPSHMRRLVTAGAITPVAVVPAGALLAREDVEAFAAERRRNPPKLGRPRKRRPEAAIAA